MRGRVIGINNRKGFIAVDTGNGITVIELLGGYEVDMDDTVSGDLEAHGGETIINETQNESMEVFIQGVHCTPENAKFLMS